MELVKFALKIHMAQLQTQLHATAVLMEKLLEAKLDRQMSVPVVSKLFLRKNKAYLYVYDSFFDVSI